MHLLQYLIDTNYSITLVIHQVCHILRIFLSLHEMLVIRHAMACSRAKQRSFPMWAIMTTYFRYYYFYTYTLYIVMVDVVWFELTVSKLLNFDTPNDLFHQKPKPFTPTNVSLQCYFSFDVMSDAFSTTKTPDFYQKMFEHKMLLPPSIGQWLWLSW